MTHGLIYVVIDKPATVRRGRYRSRHGAD
jgi:hypothetical protein